MALNDRRGAPNTADSAAAGVAGTELRLLLVWMMGTILVVVAGGVFDQFRWELLPAPLLPVAVAYSTRSRVWIVRTVALGAAVGVSVIATMWMAAGSLDEIGSGLAEGPRRLLTTEWPSPTEPTIVGTLALLVAAVSGVAALLAISDRLHLVPLVPLIVGLICLLALSAPHQPEPWLLAVAGTAAVAFVLTGPLSAAPSRHRSLLADRTVPITIVGLLMIAIVASSTLAWTDRATPRSIEPAELSAVVLDPIEAIVALRQADPPIDLLHITDRSSTTSAALPDRWRFTALDDYDGQRWVPRLTLRPIGGTLAVNNPATNRSASAVRYEIEYLTDDLDTVVFPGRPVSVDVDVETDVDRVVVRLPQRPEPGDTVVAMSEVAPLRSEAATAVVVTRQVDEIAATFTAQATTLAGDGTVFERLQQVEQTMRAEWQLDPAAPGGGQQVALIERFATETRRGTNEQFVTAFVLFARSLGFDARVATGLIVPPGRLGIELTIDSTHAAVWPEVQLTDLGWLAFDPVPSAVSTDVDEPPPPPQAQSPAAAQPPIAEPAEPAEDVDDTVVDDRSSRDGWQSIRTWLFRVGAVGGLSVLPFVAAFGSVLIVKWRRRRRRLRVDDPLAIILGAWANTTDALTDAGLSIAPAWTDDRIASRAAPLAPSAPHELRRLASMATAVTFGATSPATGSDSRRLADDAVLTSNAVTAAIRSPLSRLQRVRWRLSARSIRRSTRSPVDA